MPISPIRPGTPPLTTLTGASPAPVRRPLIPDVLLMSAPSCCERLTEIGGWIAGCFTKVWDWIKGLCGARPKTLYSNTSSLVLNPIQSLHRITDPNKIFAYNQLAWNRDVSGSIIAEKFTLNYPQLLNNHSLTNLARPQITLVNGPFRYDNQTADTAHWTANFADSNLFGFCEGPLLAQDELQVLEHPGLAHIKHELPTGLRTLWPYEATLFRNVPRLGSLDTSTPLSNGQTLYGNYFSAATRDQILSRLTRFAVPTESNIFAMAAPHISPSLNGHPYQRSDLEKLFFTAFNAFRATKQASPGKRVVIHTGNWGAGAFGNDPKTVHLIQLAAARFAGVDEIRMYPMSSGREFQAARQLFAGLETQFPEMTVEQFLDHLTANAATYNLKYGLGNGT